jgi:spermidine/putrescine transport system permease protein
MLILLVAPVLLLLSYSVLTAGLFSVSGPLTLDNYQDALTSRLTWTLAKNSAIVGLLVASVAVAVGIPVAYWLRYRAGRWLGVVLFLVVLSMFASYLVRIYAWRSILGSRGVINSALESVGLIDQPSRLFIFNRAAVVVALVHITLPYVILVIYAALRPVEPRYLEAAQDLGAGKAMRWRRLILPLLAGPAISAFLFTFVLASADFVTPQFLGGASDSMVGVEITARFTATGNWGVAAALSFLLLVMYGLCYAVASVGLRRTGLSRITWS